MTGGTMSHFWRPQVSYSCFSCTIFSDRKYRIIALDVQSLVVADIVFLL